MTVDRDDKGRLYYEYTLSSEDAPQVRKTILKPSEVLHIPGLEFDGLVGYSPIAVAKNAIGLSIATEEYGAKFFATDARRGVKQWYGKKFISYSRIVIDYLLEM